MVSLTVVSAACSSDGARRAGDTATDSQADAAEAVGDRHTRPDTVRVVLDEYSIGMPAVLPSGRTILALESRGFEEHNLLFVRTESDSLVWQTGRRLSPYETRTVTVDLTPGDYTVLCDFSGHEGRGMFTRLRVEPAVAP